MTEHISSKSAFACMLIFVFTIFSLILFPENAHAQTLPFLISPYYDSHGINQGWSSAFEPNHHAYDYDLNYQNLLAADSGTVTKVQWYSNTY